MKENLLLLKVVTDIKKSNYKKSINVKSNNVQYQKLCILVN